MEDCYIPMTLHAPNLWAFLYKVQALTPRLVHFFVYVQIKKAIIKVIKEYNPDVIISVHSMFTHAVTKAMKKENIDIPFYTAVRDLVKPPAVWYDKLTDFYFVPTDIIKQDYIKKGFDADKIMEFGFPVRSDIEITDVKKVVTDKIKILMVNPSVKLKKSVKFVTEASKIENSEIKIICGRDEQLYNALKKLKDEGKLSSNVEVFGFVTNMNDFLRESHVILTKAGPNMMIEAIRSKTALVITGHIRGQENHNYEFATTNHIGIKCENPNKIYATLDNFIKSNQLNECLEKLQTFKVQNGAEVVANYVIEHIK